MKILITGGSGLLGQYLNIELSKENEILTQYNLHEGNCKNYNSVKVDLNEKERFERVFKNFLPEVVIHTAAFTSPILPPSVEPRYVFQTNVTTTQNIAELCKGANAKLIYTSTDLVYAGYRCSMLNEDAKLIPVSLYAETKLMAEIKINEIFDNYLILRMSLMFGFGLNHSTCHFHQMYNNLKQGERVKLFSDQFRTPISLFEAARIINQLCQLNLKKETINVGSKERVSRVELGEMLCSAAEIDKSLIEKVTMDSIPDLAKVEDVSLNTDKLQSYGVKLKSIKESIKEILSSK